jgi:5-hydroxyisourate hydrolase-like protein (transthyretin family)
VQFVGGCGGAGNWAPQWWRYDQTDRKVTYLHAGKGHGFSGINGSLRPGAAISGTVTAAVGGAPLKGVCVTAAGTGGMGQVEVQGVTASNGSYRLPDLGTGSYRVRFDPSCGQRGNYLGTKHAALVRATDGKTTKGIDAHLQPGASISGVVTSQANGTPVAGICVDLAKSAGAIDGLDEVYTNASGEYTFSQLRAGSYVVGYTGGCGNTGSYAPVYYDGQVSPATATPIPVAAAQQVTGINEAMPAGGTIAGTVTRSSGASLKDVCVVTTSRNYAGGLGSNPFLLSEFAAEADESDLAFTGKNGTYRIPNMPPGQYQTAFFGGCGNGTASYAARTFAPQGGTGWVSVGAGTTTSGVSAALSVGGSISGTVTGTAGRKLGGICVMAVSKAEPAVLTAEAYSEPISSGDGRYVLPGLPAGRYAVDFTPCFGPAYGPQWYKGVAGQSSARLVTVRTGHASTGINAALTAGGTLTGKVTAKATGKPVANVCVLITDSDGNPVAGALTAANGIYRLVHVPAGRWTVDPDPCESANPALGGIVRKDVRTHGASTSLALTLPKAGQVTGTVLGGTPAAAEPDLCVEATPATGDGEPGIAVTGADGGYDLTGLAPGQYLIAFTPYCLPGTAAVVPQWYNNAAPKVNETPVTVTGGKVTSGVGATLVSDGGISGTVTVSSAPAAGVCVGAYDGPASTPAEVAITGANGSYQLAGLTPGSYSVEFTAGCGAASYTTQWYSGVTTRAAASTITVDPGSVTSGIDAS